METLEPEELRRYGIVADPYQLTGPIDPLQSDAPKPFSLVSGFRRVEQIDGYLQGKIDRELPAYFLVTGGSGTGRSSTANHIMAHYCRHRHIPFNRFILPRRDATTNYVATNSSELRVFKAWFSELRNVLHLKKITLNDDLKESFSARIKDADDDTMRSDYRALATDVSDSLRGIKPPFAFGCCLEEVKEYRIVEAALEIFSSVPTICVFTVDDYKSQRDEIVRPFSEKHSRERTVELYSLKGQEVSALLRQRWESSCPASCHFPFKMEELSAAFDDKPRPVGRVLSLIIQMFKIKLIKTKDNGTPWPHNEDYLFDADDLRILAVLDPL